MFEKITSYQATLPCVDRAQLKKNYDWIVIGNDPAGLWLAVLATQQGQSVLILPIQESFGVQYLSSGFFLDPESNYCLGLGSHKVGHESFLQMCFKKNPLLHDFKFPSFLESHSVDLQVLTSQARILIQSVNDLLSEFHRELGSPQREEEALLQSLITLKDEGVLFGLEWFESHQKSFDFSWRQFLKKKNPIVFRGIGLQEKVSKILNSETQLSQCMRGLTHLMGTEGDLFYFHLVMLLGLLPTGISFAGGMQDYRRTLMELAQQGGAHVMSPASQYSILVRRGKWKGVRCDPQTEDWIAGKRALGGCTLKTLQPWICELEPRWWKKSSLNKSPQPMGWKFTWALLVHASGIPEGATSRMQAGSLEIEIPRVLKNPVGFSALPQDLRIVFLRTVFPYEEKTLTLSYQQASVRQMFEQIKQLFPFLERHWVQSFPLLDSALLGLEEWKKSWSIYEFKTLESIPELLLVQAQASQGSNSGISHLWMAHSESYPALGSLGSLMTMLPLSLMPRE